MNETERRDKIIVWIRKKYIPSKTKNISIAIQLFVKDVENNVIKDKNIAIPCIITRGTKPKNWIDKGNRPRCPKCSAEMGLRPIMMPKGKNNVKGYRSCWECLNCGYEQYSEKTILDWKKEFQGTCDELSKKSNIKGDITS
jgi:hypothetical protein